MNPQDPNNTMSMKQDVNPSGRLAVLFMAIFVILSLSAVAFLWYQNQQLKKIVLSYKTQQILPTSKPSIDNKVYTNNKYNYSLEIPPSFKAGFENVYLGRFEEATGVEDQVSFLPSENDQFKNFLTIQVNKPTKNINLLEEVNKIYKKQKDHFQTTSVSDLKQSTFTNQVAYEYVYTGEAMYTNSWDGAVENGQYKVIFTKKDDNIYAIYLRNSDTFNQILSTFQFTGPSEASAKEDKFLACTMEAKLCPDGSSVGRTGPNCEFTPCPIN